MPPGGSGLEKPLERRPPAPAPAQTLPPWERPRAATRPPAHPHAPVLQGADRLLLAVFDGNYDLCTRNNLRVIEPLIRMLSTNATSTPAVIKCLQCLAVANQIPVHRNQQQILQSLVTNSCLQGLQQLAALPDPDRQRLVAILDLVCTCCVGHYGDAQAVAQGLVPLVTLLKLKADFSGFQWMAEQESLLRCLQEVWDGGTGQAFA